MSEWRGVDDIVEFKILGPLEVAESGCVIDVGGPKQRAVLAALVLDVGKVVSLDRLIDELWGDQAPPRATGTLQAYISNLRRALEPDRAPRTPPRVLATRPPGYVLQVAPEAVDAVRFERLLVRGREFVAEGRPAAARAALDEALGLWRGTALADLAFEPFTSSESNRLEELRRAAVESRIDADLGLGRHATVVGELEKLVAEQPFRERHWELLMLALYRSGRQGEALRAYQSARTVLTAELGVEPGPALRQLERDVLVHAPSLDWQPPAPELPAEARATRARVPPPLPLPPEPPEPLVGRDAALATLTQPLRAAAGAAPKLMLVAGEPGIGKSRLMEALATEATACGIDVAWGACSETAGAPAFWPWLQVLRAIVGERDVGEVDRAIGRHRDDLSQILPDLADPASIGVAPSADDADTARFQLYDSVTGFLSQMSHGRRLVVVLDDLQWADPSSLRLLQFLVTDRRPRALLVVAAYRDVEVTPSGPLDQVLTALAAVPTAERVALVGLDMRDVGEYIAQVTGSRVSDEVAGAVHRRTAGNPLFVAELVRLLMSEGRLADVGAAEGGLPAGVRAVIRRRIERLPEEAQTMLGAAAVAGEEFGLDALEQVMGVATERLLDLVEVALVTKLLVETGDRGRYRFTHALVRETLYDDLTAIQRARAHRRVAEAFENLWRPDLEPHIAELAFLFSHAAEAGAAESAVEYATRAARQAATGLAYEQAAEHWRQALAGLQLARPGDREARYEILMGLSEAERCSGEIASSREALQEAIAVVTRMGDAERMARAAVSFGGGTMWSWRDYGVVDHQAIDVLERALDALGTKESALRSEVLSTLAVELYYADQRNRSDELSREALAMADRLGDPKLKATALNMHYIASLGPDRPETRLAIAEKLVALPDAGAPAETGLVGRLYRMVCRLELGDIGAADADLDPAARMAEELRQPALIAQVAWYRAMRALLVGRYAEAEASSTEALAIHQRTSLWGALECFSTQLFTLRRDQGRILELEPLLADFATTSEFRGFREAAALMYLDLERTDDARRVLGDLAGQFPSMPRDWSWLFLTCLQAEVCAAIGGRDAAERLSCDLAPFADLNAVIGTGICCWGPVSYFLGRLAASLGRFDEAEQRFDEAIAAAGRLAAPPWRARAQFALGALLRERDDSGDGTRAVTLLESSAETAAELGMAGLDLATDTALRPASR